MNWKIIICAIAALTGIYYGSVWLKQRGDLAKYLQEVPYIKSTAGHFLDFGMKKSKDDPMCSSDCEGVSRYLFTMRGERMTLLLAADYNKITHQFGHRIYCDENGKPLLMDNGMKILVCR